MNFPQTTIQDITISSKGPLDTWDALIEETSIIARHESCNPRIARAATLIIMHDMP